MTNSPDPCKRTRIVIHVISGVLLAFICMGAIFQYLDAKEALANPVQVNAVVKDKAMDTLSGKKGKETVTYRILFEYLDKSGEKITQKGAEKLRDKGFDELGFDVIEIDVAYCNQGSEGIAKHVRAVKEREKQIKDGKGKYHKGTKYVLKRNIT